MTTTRRSPDTDADTDIVDLDQQTVRAEVAAQPDDGDALLDVVVTLESV